MPDGQQGTAGMDRRGFFRIVGASGAAAAAAGCGKTTESILPYVIPAEHLVPGVATWFATVCRECSAGCGVLAKSREGRIVKLEGNPDHPVNRGALCASGQASLLSTYDPDRIPGPRVREGETWRAVPVADAQKLLVDKVAAARQAGAGRIAMLTQLETGTLGRLADEWLKAVGGRPRRLLRDVRARGSPGGEPGRLRARRDPVSRLRGRPDDPVARRGLPRDVDLAGGVRGGVPAGAHASRGARRPRDPRRAAVLDDGGQRRRVDREPPGRRGGHRARPAAPRPGGASGPGAAGQGGRGPHGRGPDGGRRGGRQAERRPGGQAEAPGRGPGQGSAEPRGVGRRGGERSGRRRRPGRREPPQLRPGQRGPDGPLRTGLGPGAGEPVRGRARPDEGHGPGRDRRPDREGREPGLHAPGARRVRRGARPRSRSW